MDDAQNNLVNTHSIDIKNMQNGTKSPKKLSDAGNENCFVPPDGGTRAWVVMICSFFCNGILFGIINSSGVFHKEFSRYLETMKDSEASRKAALVESLIMGTVFIISPVAGVLTDAIGLRTTTFLGGAIAAGGLFLSSFCDYNIEALYFTFGIMFGLGGALAYTPSLAILGHYFKRNLGVVNGIVTAGSSTFTVIMSYFIDWLLKNAKIAWTFRVLAVLVAGIMGCALLFKPLNTKSSSKKGVTFSGAFNISIWKNKRYVIWALLVPFSLFGYFVPYVHMPKFVEVGFSKDADGKLPVTLIGITSLIGRLLFGYIADLPRVDRILLQQMSILCMGVLTMLIPASEGSFPWLVVISLAMGLFDGCFISLLGPIAFELCGQDGATQAIGFLLGLCSMPLTLGPFLAGMLYDQTSSYEKAFIYAGIPPIIGAILLFSVRCVKTSRTPLSNDPSEEPLQYHKNLNNEHLKGTHALDIRTNGKICSSDTVDDRPEEEPNIRQ
ncbi:hypothetical protein ILUMI_05859 [Ignelater luminosus]|uniref:Monocarboxylate transporter 10 n=1 Tax=Ignelater luminosus TaxID=2038154 RepID=A0A8K0D6X5_IGNLU|nr:hypothetical protein ILUMI_05859 [Ignelater luminosus]